MIKQLLEIIGLMLISSVKFLFAPAAVYAADYNFISTILITSLGGFVGVFIFYKSGQFISEWWIRRFSPKKNKKKFTRRNRAIIKIRARYGLYGLAFITPCIISIPIGSLLAAKYYRYDPLVLPLMFTSVLLWSLLLTSITFLVGPIFA